MEGKDDVGTKNGPSKEEKILPLAALFWRVFIVISLNAEISGESAPEAQR